MVSNKRSCVMKISDINRVAGTNPRADLSDAVVRDYASAMRLGDVFPPVSAITDGCEYWLVDGFHRVAALEYNGQDSVVVVYASGTVADAMWESCAANKAHGLHRSNADKRRAVERALLNPRGARLSDRQIGRYCSVHHDTVGRIRRELVASGGIAQMSLRDVVRNGKSYSQAIEGVAASNRSRRGSERPGAASKADVQPIRDSSDAGEHARDTPTLCRSVTSWPTPAKVQPDTREGQASVHAPTRKEAAVTADPHAVQVVGTETNARRQPKQRVRSVALESLESLLHTLINRTGDVVAVVGRWDHTEISELVGELRRVSARLLQALDGIDDGPVVSRPVFKPVSTPVQREPPQRPNAI